MPWLVPATAVAIPFFVSISPVPHRILRYVRKGMTMVQKIMQLFSLVYPAQRLFMVQYRGTPGSSDHNRGTLLPRVQNRYRLPV